MPESTQIARILILTGAVILVLGVAVGLTGRVPWLGRLPGDFSIRRGSTTIYLPLATSILLSILLTIILRFVLRK